MIAHRMHHLIEVQQLHDLSLLGTTPTSADFVIAMIKDSVETHIPTIQQAARMGHRIIATIPARRISEERELQKVFSALDPHGVDLMVVGGNDLSVGRFEDSMGLLYYLKDQNYIHSKRMYFAAHPEGTIDSTPEYLLATMKQKEEFCTKLGVEAAFITQLCVVPAVYAQWVSQVRDAGITSPLYFGVSSSCSSGILARRLQLCFGMRKTRQVASSRAVDEMHEAYDAPTFVQALDRKINFATSKIEGMYWCGFEDPGSVAGDIARYDGLS